MASPRFEGDELHLYDGLISHLTEQGEYSVPAHQMRKFVAFLDQAEEDIVRLSARLAEERAKGGV